MPWSVEVRKAYMKAYNKAYTQRQDVKAKRKAYLQRPDVKARKNAHEQQPEVRARTRAREKAYYERPDVKARVKAYWQMPEVKARLKARHQAILAGSLPEGNTPKKCEDCGRDFGASRSDTKYCLQCRKSRLEVASERNFLIKDVRRKFAVIAVTAPDEARAFLDDIEAEEGPEFRKMLLDGIPERAGVRYSDDPG